MALLSFARRAAGAAAVAALAGGCDFTHPPTYVPGDPEQLLVHAVLVAGSDSVAVAVGRVGTGEGYAPLSGAQVRILGGGATAVLSEQPGPSTPCMPVYAWPGAPGVVRTGCYAAVLPGGVRAGAEYRLEVDVPAGERVRGTTVVPDPPALLSPAERLRVPALSMEWGMQSVNLTDVQWTVDAPVGIAARAGRIWAAGVQGAQCTAYTQREQLDPAEVDRDSVRIRLALAGCTAPPDSAKVQPDSGEVMVAVSAYDSAYAAYFRNTENGIPLERASSGLEGAFGLFGSAGVSTRRVILYRQ